MKNLEGAQCQAYIAVVFLLWLPLPIRILILIILFVLLFQAVLADLSTLKVMPLLQIFLFATVT